MFALGPWLQSQGLARRKIIDGLATQNLWLNGNHAHNFRQPIQPGDIIRLGSGDTQRVWEVGTEVVAHKLILFHKPEGVIVSHSDGHNNTIFSLLPDQYRQGRFFVGRLDKDSRGLVILTNKSDLVHKWEHPSFHIPKRYVVRISKPLSKEDAETMKKGIYVDDFGRFAKKGEGEFLKLPHLIYREVDGQHILDIILTEGKKRHIRRVCRGLNYKILDLVRTHIGPYALGNLKPGAFQIMDIPANIDNLSLPPSIQKIHTPPEKKTTSRSRVGWAKPKWKR
ncbi:MAG: pseudouridine synthase [Candidatus Absconditabacterales bacterium]|nr:pseudouridine synthase [Candidatus Absconditabacterales bacterium]